VKRGNSSALALNRLLRTSASRDHSAGDKSS
jgi:hypothetical protein